MTGESAFAIEQSSDADGSVRLSLIGELDHIEAATLLRHLGELKATRKPVRLDLTRLQFIDSGGVRAILLSVRDATHVGWNLRVERRVSWQVDQVFSVLGVDAMLWPENGAAEEE